MLRHDWTTDEILEIMQMPFMDLIYKAQTIHRANFDANELHLSSLLSIKTGSCPEDCKYCPQSAHYQTNQPSEKLLDKNTILEKAKLAKDAGATTFCMGAAWRNPKDSDMPFLVDVIKMVKALGLNACMTLGMLTESQAKMLKEAGLDYYNHNIDTSEEFYDHIISTRTFNDRLETLKVLRKCGIKICTGGIMGMGETIRDRASFLKTLANLDPHPESVPINLLVKIPGTPLAEVNDLDILEFIRVIATARIIMPKSYIRLSAGRTKISREAQTLAIMAGSNSIFLGCKLLTTQNVDNNDDLKLIKDLGLITTIKDNAKTPMQEQNEILSKIHDNKASSNDHKCIKLNDLLKE